MLLIADADSAENDSPSSHHVITPLSCALPRRREGGPKGSGDEQLKILPGTRLRSICGSVDAAEQYYCNYGVNPDYLARLRAAGLCVSGIGDEGEVRLVELPEHPFFVATLFLPQARSTRRSPHPLLQGFAAALGGRC